MPKAPIVERAGDYVKRSVVGGFKGLGWLAVGGVAVLGLLAAVPFGAPAIAAGVEGTRLGVMGALA